jgi:hypothetical protein
VTWPRVLTEAETLERLVGGASIARFGDGELKICCGGATVTHHRDAKLLAKLAKELRGILKDPAPGLLPAIPNPRAVKNRWKSWETQRDQWCKLMDMDIVYGSAFVGRKKVAPWVDTPKYRERFRSIWKGRNVVAVCPPTHPLPGWLEQDCHEVAVVECPLLEAYAEIDDLEAWATDCAGTDTATSRSRIIIICAGPAAKPLANRLARRGIRAIDLGRGAGFLYKGE